MNTINGLYLKYLIKFLFKIQLIKNKIAQIDTAKSLSNGPEIKKKGMSTINIDGILINIYLCVAKLYISCKNITYTSIINSSKSI